MRGLRTLIAKEWRDARGITIASAVIALLATLAIRLSFLPHGHRFSGHDVGEAAAIWFVPAMVTVYLAVVAADIVAAEAASGGVRTLALLPTRLRTTWTAKVSFLVLAGVVFAMWVALCQVIVLGPLGKPGTLTAFFQNLPAAWPRFGAGAAFTCVVLFFSTLLQRGFAAGLAAVVTVASLLFTVWALARGYPDAMGATVKDAGVALAVVALALLFVTGSAVTFARGPIHTAGWPRRAALGLGVVLGVLVPTTAAGAAWLHDWVYFDPGEPGIQIGLVSVSPDGRHLVVGAGRETTRTQHQTWILDLETGEIRVLPRLGLQMDWGRQWTHDGRLRVWIVKRDGNRQSYERLQHIDPATGKSVKEQTQEEVFDPAMSRLQPYGDGWAIVSRSGRDPWKVSWPDRDLAAEFPDSTFVWASRLPGYVAVKGPGSDLTLHDLLADRETDLNPDGAKTASALFSPHGEYLYVWTNLGTRVVRTTTGERVYTPTGGYGWPGGGSPDRFGLEYGADAPTRLVDLETGTPLELTPDPNRYGHPAQSVRVLPDHRIVVAHEDGSIHVLDAQGRHERVLYAPREVR